MARWLKARPSRRLATIATTLAISLIPFIRSAHAQTSSSASYRISVQTTGPDGGVSASASYAARTCLSGTAGGAATSASYRLQAGCGATLMLGLDYGDAPDAPYPSSRANDGARHLLATSLRLGSAVDAELDAPTSSEGGDDGVTFTSPIIPGAMASVDVVVSTSGGLLDAWIDFNNDGDWDDSGEQIFASESLPAVDPAVNSLMFNVPSGAKQAGISARFRLSSAGGLAATGFAGDGEVEDYVVDTVPVELQSFSVGR